MADFRAAVLITIDPEHEGGFQRNANDRANWTGGSVGVGRLVGTKYGITAIDVPGVDVEGLTADQAVAFYQERYWKPLYSQISSQLVANKLFDLGVLFGIGTAVRKLQGVLNLTQDGQFGPETLAAVNDADESDLLNRYKTEMCSMAVSIANGNTNELADLTGWIHRINT